jgi:cytochrome c oxidase accessory protein FixG
MGNEEFRDHISTVNEDGKRVWIFPKRPKGSYYNKRKIVSYLLLAFLFSAPHIRLNNEPLLLFNIIDQKFVIFGSIFWPQDMYLLALSFILFIIFIIVFTIIFGRLFCGWACPQTIFMEMVFRRIEYWIEGDYKEQIRLKNAPWSTAKVAKRIAKHSAFLLISFLIANTFLAYIIGSEHLWSIQTSNIKHHLGGFISISIFSLVFYGVFAWLREQVCTTICPYGRLQGVLLDRNSMVVGYDHIRGESRAKIHKNEDRAAAGKGDCIDCNHCVHVCPTGIDIRNGTQLECTNCTACIDACDEMMVAVGLPTNLIGYKSIDSIEKNTGFQWTRRVKAYTILLIALLAVLITLLITRKDFETEIMRQRGSTYTITSDGLITNIFDISILNKTHDNFKLTFKCNEPGVKIETVDKKIILKSGQQIEERILIKAANRKFTDGVLKIKIQVFGNGRLIETKKTKIIGPYI